MLQSILWYSVACPCLTCVPWYFLFALFHGKYSSLLFFQVELSLDYPKGLCQWCISLNIYCGRYLSWLFNLRKYYATIIELCAFTILCLLRFLLPASLIVINDIFAYLFGFFLGRTPLIKLSPKKTWEGFIGASVTTIISAFLVRLC